jgi:CO dehydrogenase maturation factor
LAATLGFPNPENITPITEMKELIEERTGTKSGQIAPYFKLNPKVDDIPENYTVERHGIRLMVMGRVKKGGSGCYCPENALVLTLLTHLLVARNEVVILDMAAGIEHLGRGTARAVNALIVVVEPGRRSIETALKIFQMARDLGLNNIVVVGNKIRNQVEKDFLLKSLDGFELLGFIPYDEALVQADIANLSLLDSSQKIVLEVKNVFHKLLEKKGLQED